jgi:hypothetical protein
VLIVDCAFWFSAIRDQDIQGSGHPFADRSRKSGHPFFRDLEMRHWFEHQVVPLVSSSCNYR